MKLFSIIIPAYNAEKSIEECIDSIILQDMQNYEVIIVDDKSNDNTIEKLRKYKDYENIKVIRHTKNKKAGGARNTGIKSAQGDYILFLDADDKIIGNSLTKLEKVINENNKPDVIYMGFQYKTSQNIYLPNEDSAPAKRLAEWEFPNVWDVLWKREFILKNHLVFEEEKYYEEYKEVLKRVIGKLRPDLPILYNVNFGHASPITIIPYGIECELDCKNKKLTLTERCLEDTNKKEKI